MMRLTIDTEPLGTNKTEEIINAFETEFPNITIKKRKEYEVLAFLGTLEDIEKAISVLKRFL